jgi:hypothetical protein
MHGHMNVKKNVQACYELTRPLLLSAVVAQKILQDDPIYNKSKG